MNMLVCVLLLMVLTGMRASALALSQESWLACSMTSLLGQSVAQPTEYRLLLKSLM
jgi:hypothetical protein